MNKPIIAIVAVILITSAALATPSSMAEQSVDHARSVQAERHGVSSEAQESQSTNCISPDTCPVTLAYVRANKAPVSTSSRGTLSVAGAVVVPDEDVVEDVERTPKVPIVVVGDVEPEPKVAVIAEEEAELAIEAPEAMVAKEIKDTSAADFMSELAAEIHRLTNLERARAGLSALVFDKELAVIAELHSTDMADNNYFSHTAPGNCDLACRYEKADYSARAWGENIAWRSANPLPDAAELAAFFVREWMDSPGHRRNILLSSFTHEGVGLARIGNKVYATVNFAQTH